MLPIAANKNLRNIGRCFPPRASAAAARLVQTEMYTRPPSAGSANNPRPHFYKFTLKRTAGLLCASHRSARAASECARSASGHLRVLQYAALIDFKMIQMRINTIAKILYYLLHVCVI